MHWLSVLPRSLFQLPFSSFSSFFSKKISSRSGLDKTNCSRVVSVYQNIFCPFLWPLFVRISWQIARAKLKATTTTYIVASPGQKSEFLRFFFFINFILRSELNHSVMERVPILESLHSYVLLLLAHVQIFDEITVIGILFFCHPTCQSICRIIIIIMIFYDSSESNCSSPDVLLDNVTANWGAVQDEIIFRNERANWYLFVRPLPRSFWQCTQDELVCRFQRS